MEKRNKKIHSWTAKQIRKRIKNSGRHGNAPKSYCKPFWRQHRAKELNEISRFMKGIDEGFLHFPYHHKNSATWDYW